MCESMPLEWVCGRKSDENFSKMAYVVNVEFFIHNLWKCNNLCLIFTNVEIRKKVEKVNTIYIWGVSVLLKIKSDPKKCQ